MGIFFYSLKWLIIFWMYFTKMDHQSLLITNIIQLPAPNIQPLITVSPSMVSHDHEQPQDKLLNEKKSWLVGLSMNTLSKVVKAPDISTHHTNMKISPCPVFPSCIYYLLITHSIAKLSNACHLYSYATEILSKSLRKHGDAALFIPT